MKKIFFKTFICFMSVLLIFGSMGNIVQVSSSPSQTSPPGDALSPVADTFFDEEYPGYYPDGEDAGKGTGRLYLFVGHDNIYGLQQAALKFDTSNFSGMVQEATLWLYVGDVVDGGGNPYLNIWGSHDHGWQEDTQTPPSKGQGIMTDSQYTISYDHGLGWHSFDVTEYVQSQLNQGWASFVLGGPEEGAHRLIAFPERKHDNHSRLEITMVPVDPPTVTTASPTSVSTTFATLGGNVTDDGGAAVTERGIVYSTSPNPTTDDNKAQMGTGTGSFSQSVSGLSPGTTYYVRAYAINSEGTSYGSQQSFTTNVSVTSIVRSDPSSSITNSNEVTYQVNLSGPVSGLSSDHFSLTSTGISGASITSVSGSGTSYLVSVNTGTGDGTLRLNMVNSLGVAPTIAGLPFTSGHVYTIDKTPPAVSITSDEISPTDANPIPLNIDFSEDVTGFDISDISVSGGTLSNFSGSGASYTVDVTPISNGTTITVNVNADVAEDDAGNGNTAASPFDITYFVPSDNADLSNLVLSEGTLSPSFDAGTISYTASVLDEVTSLTVTPTVDDANATVTVDGVAVTSGEASGPISLNVGENDIEVEVTAEDGTTTKQYTVSVTRMNEPPAGSLSINDGDPFTNSSNVTLAVTYDDPESDPVEMRFSNDGSNWGVWEAASSTKSWELSSGDGPKTVYMQLQDVHGNVSPVYSESIILDTIPPVVSGVIDGGMYNDDVTIEFSDATSTPSATLNGDAFTSGTTVSDEGAHTLIVTDEAGNEASVHFTIDKTPPAGSLLINGGESFTNNTNVSLYITASDETSSVEMRFSNDDSTWSSWESATANRAWTLTANDGTKTVYMELRDEAGNVSSFSDVIILDTESPTGSLIINSGDTHTNEPNVSLQVTAHDDLGVISMRFSNDNDDWSEWEAAAGSKVWMLESGDGAKTVYMELRDEAGNVSSFDQTIVLDTTPPEVTGVQDDGMYNHDVTITFSDATSTPSATLNGDAFTNGTTVSDEGAYTLVVIDEAGNETTVNFTIDKTPPTGAVEINGGTDFTNDADVMLSITASDNLSDTIYMRFSNDNDTWSAWEAVAGTKDWSLEGGDGEKTVYMQLRDEAGNVSEYSDTIILETTRPSITLDGPLVYTIEEGLNYSEPGYEASHPRFGQLTNDVIIEGDVDTDVAGEYILTYRVTDLAGNESVAERTVKVVEVIDYVVTIPSGVRSVGESFDIVVEPIYAEEVEVIDTHEAVITTSDSQVAVVEGNSVHFVGRGEVDITITYGSIVKDFAINVVDRVVRDSQPIDVSGGDYITTENEDMMLILPGDLPVGTQLEIEHTNQDKWENSGLSKAGGVYSYRLMYPEGYENFTGAFRIQFNYDDHVNPQSIGIYYYNESTGKWEYRGGTVNTEQQLIWIEVPHFSTYGVFGDSEGPEIQFFNITDVTEESVTLRFSAEDVTGISSYEIYRDDHLIETLSGDVTEFVDDGLIGGTQYDYYFIVADVYGNETVSDSITITTLAGDEGTNEEEPNAPESGTQEPGAQQPDTNDEAESGTQPNEEGAQDSSNSKLPSTATNMYTWLLAGLLLMMLGAIGLLRVQVRKST